ncbi:hypothetical protein D9M70_485670 [compost metagenome]
MVGAEAFDQFQQNLCLVFLADRLAVAVMRLRLASVGLVVEHYVEQRLQITHRLGKKCGGCERAVNQDDGLLGGVVTITLRINLALPVYVDDSGFRLHCFLRRISRDRRTAWGGYSQV